VFDATHDQSVVDDAGLTHERFELHHVAAGCEVDFFAPIETVDEVVLVERQRHLFGVGRVDFRLQVKRGAHAHLARQLERLDEHFFLLARLVGNHVNFNLFASGFVGLGEHVAGGLVAIGKDDHAWNTIGRKQAVGVLNRRLDVRALAGLFLFVTRDRRKLCARFGHVDHVRASGERQQLDVVFAARFVGLLHDLSGRGDLVVGDAIGDVDHKDRACQALFARRRGPRQRDGQADDQEPTNAHRQVLLKARHVDQRCAANQPQKRDDANQPEPHRRQ
jgi:hypothetical protein